MLHKNALGSSTTTKDTNSTNLRVMPAPGTVSSRLLDLAAIASRRCSAFFAEAAVLVLVFGILDYFMLKGRIELPWIVGALTISVGLLAASIAMDFTAHRWIKSHP
jgi:hypothetical protein